MEARDNGFLQTNLLSDGGICLWINKHVALYCNLFPHIFGDLNLYVLAEALLENGLKIEKKKFKS